MAKAGRPKSGGNKLPDWFDIKKYQHVRNIHAEDWSLQLEFRKCLFGFAEESRKDNTISEAVNYLIDCWFDVIRKNTTPNKDIISNANGALYLLNNEGALVFPQDFAYGAGINEVTNCDIKNGYLEMSEKHRAWINSELSDVSNSCDDMTPEEESEWEEKFRFYGGIAANLNFPSVTVDLSLPDKILADEFRSWLASKRKETNVKSNHLIFRSVDFSRWHDCGVLPYIDLALWETRTGHPIHMPSFANAVSHLTGKSLGESGLSKTVKAHMSKLMSISTLRILRSQVMREKTGAQKKSGKLRVN